MYKTTWLQAIQLSLPVGRGYSLVSVHQCIRPPGSKLCNHFSLWGGVIHWCQCTNHLAPSYTIISPCGAGLFTSVSAPMNKTTWSPAIQSSHPEGRGYSLVSVHQCIRPPGPQLYRHQSVRPHQPCKPIRDQKSKFVQHTLQPQVVTV